MRLWEKVLRDLHIAVISHARPQNVKKMEELLQVDQITWYVNHDEVKTYHESGASSVQPTNGLVSARNHAIQDAFEQDKYCVMLDDDLKKIQMGGTLNNQKIAVDMTFKQALEYMAASLNSTPLKLAGVAPTPNLFYCQPHKPYSYQHFIVASLIMIKPHDNPLYFDKNLRTKEDYDYTLQHIKRFGGAMRCNTILATFEHYTNKGGVVEYRTPEIEQQSIMTLKRKWGPIIQDHPKRPNEILLKLPRARQT